MASDSDRLQILVEARITDLERKMARASQVTSSNFSKMESRARQFTANLEKQMVIGNPFKGLGTSLLALLAPLLSATAAIGGAKNALKQFGDIADQAKAAGLDSELFQSLTYQAKLAGVEIGDIAGALATFAKNSALAVEGKGKMVSALKALNPELLENIRNATTQAERVRLVADALDATTDPAKRAALATALFGEAGLKLGNAFQGGARAIDATMSSARQLGVIVDRDVIARADTLGDKFDTVSQVLDLRLKTALVNLGPVLNWLIGLAGDFAGEIDQAIDGLKSVQGRSLADLEAELKQLQDAPPQRFGFNFGGTGFSVGGVDDAQIAEWKKEIEQEIKRRGEAFSMDQLKALPPAAPDLPTLDEITNQSKAADAAIKHGEAVQSLINDLVFEGQQIGKTAEQQEIANNLHRAGVTAESDEGKAIAALTAANFEHQQAVENLAEAYQQVQDLSKTALSTFVDDLRQGKSATDALADSLNRVADELIDMALDAGIKQLFGILTGALSGGGVTGGTLGAGLWGTAIFKAAGGPVRGPGSSTSDSIPAMLSNGEYVVNSDATKQFRGLLDGINFGGKLPHFAIGGLVAPSISPPNLSMLVDPGNLRRLSQPAGDNITVHNHIDARGAELGVEVKIANALQRYDRNVLPTSINRVQRNPYIRG